MSHKKSNMFIMDAIILFFDGRLFCCRQYIGLFGKRVWGRSDWMLRTNNGVELEHLHFVLQTRMKGLICSHRFGSEDVCIIVKYSQQLKVPFSI